jgi:CRP-like cAMP-binding protein
MAARTAVLSEGQLALLAEHGEERRAAVGDVLFRVGDRRYPLIAIVECEAAILDQTGAEINRHGPGGFLGEANLLSGQTVFFTAIVTEPLRYIVVEREELRTLLFEDSALSDLLLWTFTARREGLQARKVSAPRSSGRIRPRRRDSSSSSRAATACRSRGSTPTAPTMRRRSPRSPGSRTARSRSCA